ncbi:MAG: hypothetical protein DMG04_18595 [Acidobacteria bacterium]|nr:MAG: hypothetical protein DMG04_18595 [Acidobacteriota bacterium]PYQ79388.1 MAG: hypothetical protein DMG03_25970 [Acidobacteriota bacterium]PYQ85581.1 MAG: hypothetical protein DMG02_27445 [Acidobacteriota bacterium]PYR07074.1 MAG: hypothetical protein DMF99_24040 [Acidobacteriota bacterium]
MIEATRTRLSFTGEWLTAALFLAATLVVAVLVVRELRTAPPALASEPAPTATTVPPDAVSVPTLMLGTNEIRVGDLEADALARLDASVTLVKQSTERGPLGARTVRSYQLSGTSFILVFEPFERRGTPRVAAIYLR